MLWIISVFSALGFTFCYFLADTVDIAVFKAIEFVKKKLLDQGPNELTDLYLLSRTQSLLRSGINLESALEQIRSEPSSSETLKRTIQKILDGTTTKDFLPSFFILALETGAPISEPIKILQNTLFMQKKNQQRAKAFTAQSRAQASVLCWLPWFLLFSLAILDHDWALESTKSPYTWLLWSAAIFLSGIGKTWINNLISKSLIPKKTKDILLEQLLPELVFRLVGYISTGIDLQTSLERCLQQMAEPKLSTYFSNKTSPDTPPQILHLRALLDQANLGGPVRAELLFLLNDLQSTQECNWEERAQKLPVKCMAPLFLCFFPSCLLILLSLILPMLGELK